jgi:ribosome-associated protein
MNHPHHKRERPPFDPATAPPSKSQRKRDAHALHALGETLVRIAPAKRATLPLPEALADALRAADQIQNAHGARKRQLKFIAKLLRDTDTAPIEAALARHQGKDLAEAARFKRIETWRDRLLDEGEATIAAALAAFPKATVERLRELLQVAQYTTGDAQHGARRALFRYLRDCDARGDDAPSEA